jgi:hypothetical protein
MLMTFATPDSRRLIFGVTPEPVDVPPQAHRAHGAAEDSTAATC